MGLYVGDDLVATGQGSSKKKGEEAASKAYYQKNKDLFNG
jgi:dsRNA-specific ribonuclease